MAHWICASPSDPTHGVPSVCSVDLTVNDTNGQITGTVIFKTFSYIIAGNSAAAGSVAGRGSSVFALHGGCEAGAATSYIAMTGTIEGPWSVPTQIAASVTRIRSSDGSQYGWDGELKP
jgi:hypothetical protein